MAPMASDWTESHRELWDRLSRHAFGTADSAIDFATRLAREHGWTREYAQGALEEYRRFCFLAVVAGVTVTPSDAVDEVWHLHLTYSRDYWETFCPHVLGVPLHHEPTRGGRDEADRHYRQYAQTLAAYQQWFGAPPEAYWPHAARVFGRRPPYRRVDLDAVFVVPRPRLPSARRLGYAAAGIALLACAPLLRAQALGPLDMSGPEFLFLYLVLLLTCGIGAAIVRRYLRDTGATANAVNLDPWQTAYLAGGPARALDAGIAELLARKAGTIDASGRFHADPRPGLEFPLDAIASAARAPSTPVQILATLSPTLERLRGKLEQRGFVLTAAQSRHVAGLSALPFALLGAFGLAKVAVGIARDRPVALLVILIVITAVVAYGLYRNRPTRSRAGDDVLAALRTKHAHAVRAPRDIDVGLAVALAGTAALSGTAFAAYHETRSPPGSGGSSSDGSSSGCSSGDGGGSGCGGCGGGGD